MGQAKQRGTLEDRIKQAQMPSFIKELDTAVTDGALSITYNRADLIQQQCDFIDTAITQLQSQTHQFKEIENTRGFVFWGDKQDFSASLVEADPINWPDHSRECKDGFFARYWDTTNQTIQISEQYCDEIIRKIPFQPIGIKLKDVPRHEYSNFAVAVACTRKIMTITKNSFGDLCPPEADIGHGLYNSQFIPKVKEALAGLGIYVECDWKFGKMTTTRVKETA